jgi:hypothetical protein
VFKYAVRTGAVVRALISEMEADEELAERVRDRLESE